MYSPDLPPLSPAMLGCVEFDNTAATFAKASSHRARIQDSQDENTWNHLPCIPSYFTLQFVLPGSSHLFPLSRQYHEVILQHIRLIDTVGVAVIVMFSKATVRPYTD